MNVQESQVSTWRIAAGHAPLVEYLTEEDKAKVDEMRAAGKRDRQIASEVGVSKATLTRLYKKQGLAPRKNTNPVHSEETKKKAIALVEAGKRYPAVAREIGVAKDTVERWYTQAVAKGTAKLVERSNRGEDLQLRWVTREYPQLESWRILASEWVSEQKSLSISLKALTAFFDRYLGGHQLPPEPADLLKKSGPILPDFYKTCMPQSIGSIATNNALHEFIEWVLLRICSEEDDFGEPVVQWQLFRNPVPELSCAGMPTKSQSVKATLPYGYITQLRKLLACGPNFSDWKWAQNAMGERRTTDDGEIIPGAGSDWFEVTWAQIDKSDPDCVWRERRGVDPKTPLVLEMWSPVRWVALLHKLQTPPRGFQVRVLDSGEGDTWRYFEGQWELNEGPLKRGNQRQPVANGVFRRVEDPINNAVYASLYYNTNKTKDAKLSGTEKGFEVPWPDIASSPIEDQPYYWLEKLRNWQEKYNPVTQLTSWKELPKSTFGNEKSEESRAAFVDNYFLFRTAEGKTELERRCPLVTTLVEHCWDKLLFEFEETLAAKGETHADGSPIILIDRAGVGRGKVGRPIFTLQGLRVSLITALAIDGGMDIETLMKLVGHSRLLMTIYYVKPGFKHMKDAIIGATQRLSEKAAASIVAFLANAKSDDLLNIAIFNAAQDVFSVIEENPASRNPAGWMIMMDGICLAGGNTSQAGLGDKVRGCHNGGPKTSARVGHGPVPGGVRNCVRCRWFTTRPEFIDALRARLNNISYYLEEVSKESAGLEVTLEALKVQKYESEVASVSFARMAELKSIERQYETSMEKTLSLGMDWGACNKLIARCVAQSLQNQTGAMALIPVGDAMEVIAILEETDSKLFHVSGVCQDVDVYPDLNPGEAVRELGQMLDAKLESENMKPFFYRLSKPEQLTYANMLMRRLSDLVDPNPLIGLRKVCSIIEGDESLRDLINGDVAGFLDVRPPSIGKVIPIRIARG
ncbi:MAG: integrase [Hylemonella sp.]|nr:integrase [Hylemonella sp.]